MNWIVLLLLVTPKADPPPVVAANKNQLALYTAKIKPLLAVRCLACHGALEQKGGLRVDTVAHMLKGGDSGPGLVPGKPKESSILLRSAGHPGQRRMPPKEEGEEVGAEDLARLEQWIASGAPAPDKESEDPDPRDHWSFRKPKRAAPAVQGVNPIDTWIAKGWQAKGLTPRPEADKRTLLRRVYLDLIGLPPTPEQIDRFLADSSPHAYEREVESLLKSPLHAERWARHFMDIWRYSDWWGLGAEVRNSQKNIWHWRDWIIESLENDLPYDEMIRQMLAADELYPTDASRLRATGYLARQYFLFNRTSWMDETIEHTSKAFLGLTTNCAKCHDHKYDPIRADDYYRLRAVFEPYQVRFDAPAGSLVPAQGFPRAYDCNLEKPTHKHIRGDEARPETRRKMTPAAPPFLDFAKLEVSEVRLPAEAFAPEIRPEVLDLYLKQSAAALTAARSVEKDASEAVRLAEKAPPPSDLTPGRVIFADPFDQLDPSSWTVTGPGKWEADSGSVSQTALVDARTTLQFNRPVPDDFELNLRLRITGGDPWRSVGVSFDAADGHENNVYVSANATEPKLQIAFERNGQYSYPESAKQARPVPMNTPLDLTIRVRANSVEATMDGKSWAHLTLPDRQKGKLLLTAFTATCVLENIEIRELPTGYQSPGAKKPPTLPQAKARLAWARAEVAVSEAEPAVLKGRYQARREQVSGSETVARQAVQSAAKLEADLAVIKARAAVAKARYELEMEGPGKKPAVDAALKTLDEGEKTAKNPGVKFTRLTASVKSAESNVETAESKAMPYPATSTGRRAALARWITHPDNPLTARVVVNHVWNRHFGQALVPTLFEFGRKGLPPTHPELLDTLAVELMEHGYSLRHLHRLVVTSLAYRLDSSTSQPAEHQKDPENRMLWRFPSHRIEAQVVRDSLLHLSGKLDLTRGGPPVPVADAASRRRSLYFFHSHNEHNQFLEQFDDAGVLECYRRERSIVPQQALALTHAGLSLDASAAIAGRLNQPGMDDARFVDNAHLVLLGRPADAEEKRLCAQAIQDLRAGNKQAGPERARALVVLALLNHHDFLTRR
jgi:mono/diheme cytochrome c family protein